MKKDSVFTPLLEVGSADERHSNICESIWTIAKLGAVPVIGALFHPTYQLVNVAFVGRMGDKKMLAGLGLGSLTSGIMLLSIGTCFAFVVGVLIAQAHGAGDIRLVRILLNRQYFLNCIVYAVAVIPVFFIREIYEAIGQDPEVAAYAAKYIWFTTPGVFFFMQFIAVQMCATSMKHTSVGLVSTGSASICHLIMVYVFVEVLGWGFEGVAIATSIHFFLRFAASQIYLSTISELWEVKDVNFFSNETVENLGY